MRALAIVPAYNEADIIGWTVGHLIRQGMAVHVIDCASTDGTSKVAIKAGAAVEHYPVENGKVSWRALLGRVEALANDQGSIHHWYMLNDADEIRRSPLPNEKLIDAFDRMDRDGYDAAQFMVYVYHPTDNGYDGTQDPEQYFKRSTMDHLNMRIGQVKAWKRLDAPIELAWSGGHRIRRSGAEPRIHPLKLISKHYPIRSQQHGERKVFSERRGRWSDPEADWHVQYRGIEPGHSFLMRP